MSFKKVKLGVLGSSENNGHPYSWSAIINGYDKSAMSKCPFQAIPAYLSKHNFPEEQLKTASVTHVWTQDYEASMLISKSTKIKNIVLHPNDMIGFVDAVLLARDDYEMHEKLASPFIKAGLPIFIDKPLAINTGVAEHILNLQQYDGQIFTGSAIAYHPHIIRLSNKIDNIGKILWVDGVVPGPWDKYSVHLIDPILSVIGKMSHVKEFNVIKNNKRVHFQAITDDNISVTLNCVGKFDAPFRIIFVGTKGKIEIDINDVFPAFRASLDTFINSILNNKVAREKTEILNSIEWISKVY